jgi:hypothetical protein
MNGNGYFAIALLLACLFLETTTAAGAGILWVLFGVVAVFGGPFNKNKD